MKLSLLAGKRKLKFFFFSIGYNKKVKFPNFVQWVKIKRQTAHLYFKKYKKSKQRAGKKKEKKTKVERNNSDVRRPSLPALSH